MKQVIQSFRTGELAVREVPAPRVGARSILVHTGASLVSAGTERMVVDFAEKNLVEKARARPDLVRQVVDKAQREGVLSTLEAVGNRLDQPMALGYSLAGTVLEVGADVREFQPGDRVACAGGGHAVHAEVVRVPRTLAVPLPDNVPFDAAAFTTLGAIALQGLRLAEARLGEVVAVLGLGLLGQLTVQLLKAAGCVVVGMDPQPARAELARASGADAVATSPDALADLVLQRSGGHGADAVLITADTRSNQPLETAGEIARSKGVVVAVGAVGMTVPRKVFYEKELAFHVSRSYGPGRYDARYEEEGEDYPYAYVRWTEQRNMQAFVGLLAEGRVRAEPLITHRFPIAEAAQAYDLITGKRGEPFLGVLLQYPDAPDLRRKLTLAPSITPTAPHATPQATLAEVRLGVLGAGTFANATLLPALKEIEGLARVSIASGGLSAQATAERFGFAACTTDPQEILRDPAINTVAILTRHHLHARQTIAALEAGKHVFAEKPLCLSSDELREVVAAYDSTRALASAPTLTVGFNRRFAPFVAELRQHLARVREPLMLHCRVNAGFIPPDHWTQNPAQGGGRLLGEACHFVDLLFFLADSPIQRVTTRALPDGSRYAQDNLQITLEFANGSLGTLLYVANGDKGFPKELVEAFGGGLAARMDNFRTLHIQGGATKVQRAARLRQDKGHRAEWQALVAHLTGRGPLPIPFKSIIHSTAATLAAYESLRRGEGVEVAEVTP